MRMHGWGRLKEYNINACKVWEVRGLRVAMGAAGSRPRGEGTDAWRRKPRGQTSLHDNTYKKFQTALEFLNRLMHGL